MISRRELIQAALGLTLLPAELLAKSISSDLVDWHVFYAEMDKLAKAKVQGRVDQREMAQQGLFYLQKLDHHSDSFTKAVENSFETGNQFWLWQRLVKEAHLNGGILHIDKENFVQLHDHPGATGMLKIISGEVEVWQFDAEDKDKADMVNLKRATRRILHPGDVAVLHPDHGNVHALRSITKECSMLDFFIPPYQRSERSWYQPLEENWFDMECVECRRIPQHEYTMI